MRSNVLAIVFLAECAGYSHVTKMDVLTIFGPFFFLPFFHHANVSCVHCIILLFVRPLIIIISPFCVCESHQPKM
jgi:hypothetical protein